MSPSCFGGTPRALTKAGRKGEATPKAAYIAAYSRLNLLRVVDWGDSSISFPTQRSRFLGLGTEA
jgi:hypothetical protein